MEKYKEVQDWEYAEETSPDEWETVDIQLATKEEAINLAQAHSNRTNRRCVVSTSIRYESKNGVEDRGLAPGDPSPIIITPKS